jgi:phosphoribosylanthranilate isomerase
MDLAVKICGVTDPGTVEIAAALGASYLGFVFFPPSPRALSLDQAATLTAAVPEGIARVGVMVDPDDAMLAALLARVNLDILQLHGHETPERLAEIRERTGCRVMKALRVAEAADVAAAGAFAEVADLFLFDAKPRPGAPIPGGSGLSFDWELLRGVAPGRPWALAGGLTADNLAEAVTRTRAPIVDVSSGIESRPGVKDPLLLRRFLEEADRLRRAPEPVTEESA